MYIGLTLYLHPKCYDTRMEKLLRIALIVSILGGSLKSNAIKQIPPNVPAGNTITLGRRVETLCA